MKALSSHKSGSGIKELCKDGNDNIFDGNICIYHSHLMSLFLYYLWLFDLKEERFFYLMQIENIFNLYSELKYHLSGFHLVGLNFHVDKFQ